MQVRRASICALIDNQGEAEEAEGWLERNREKLSYVSEMNGCGCCVLSWDIEGPKEVLDTLPEYLSVGSVWASSQRSPDAAQQSLGEQPFQNGINDSILDK